MNVFSTICPTDCSALNLPVIDTEQNCTTYELYESQVCGLLMTRGAVPADWTSTAEWEARVINNVVDAEAAKYLTGIGGMPAPEKVFIEGPKLKDILSKRIFTLTFRVLNMNDTNYEFLRTLQCGGTDYRFWIETVGGHLFGGPNGIQPKLSDADLPNLDGREAMEEGTITITFEARTDPDRTAWTPIDTSVPAVPTVQSYGPVFNGTEVYGPTAGGTEYYNYN